MKTCTCNVIVRCSVMRRVIERSLTARRVPHKKDVPNIRLLFYRVRWSSTGASHPQRWWVSFVPVSMRPITPQAKSEVSTGLAGRSGLHCLQDVANVSDTVTRHSVSQPQGTSQVTRQKLRHATQPVDSSLSTRRNNKRKTLSTHRRNIQVSATQTK